MTVQSFQDFEDLLRQIDQNITPDRLLALMEEGLWNPEDTCFDLVQLCKKKGFPASGSMILPIITSLILGAVLLHDNIYNNPHMQALHQIFDSVSDLATGSVLSYENIKDRKRRGTPRGYEDLAWYINLLIHINMIYITGDKNWHTLQEPNLMWPAKG